MGVSLGASPMLHRLPIAQVQCGLPFRACLVLK